MVRDRVSGVMKMRFQAGYLFANWMSLDDSSRTASSDEPVHII